MADIPLGEVTFGTYYVRAGDEQRFEQVLPRSWSALRRLGFIEDTDPLLYRSVDGPTRYLEVARWRPGVMGPAHEHPDLIPIWVELGRLVVPHTPAPVDRGLVFDEFIPVRLGSGG